MDVRVHVGGVEGVLEVGPGDAAQLVADAVGLAGAPCPVGVLDRGGVLVREQADEQRRLAAEPRGNGLAHMPTERLRHQRRVHAPSLGNGIH